MACIFGHKTALGATSFVVILHPNHTRTLPRQTSMADVRKLLQVERRLRETNKPNPPSSNTCLSTKRTHPEIDGAAATKRQKTNSTMGLPADFFDRKCQRGTTEDVLGVDDGNDSSLLRIEEKRSAGVDENDASLAQAPNTNVNSSALPSNFLKPKSSIPSTAQVEVDEDEWAAFQADVAEPAGPEATPVIIEAAPTTNNPVVVPKQETIDDYARGEEEDAKQKLIDEFEEMESLEQRVLRLKERREALKTKVPATAKIEVVAIELDGQEDEEDEAEYDDFFQVRGS